jgi:O-antigen/teichoic acid export membrane protein
MRSIAQVFQCLLKEKLTQDIAYSLGSFVVLAVSGIVINVVIVLLRDPEALGVFNQTYAMYIMVSQFAAFGVHYSVLRYTALHEEDLVERGRMLMAAAACSLFGGIVVAALLFSLRELVADLFDGPQTGSAIGFAAFGLILFPLNKVLLAYLNGLRRIRAYAVIQALRYLTIMGVVAAFAASTMQIAYATLSFLIAEILTAFASLLFLYRTRELRLGTVCRRWITAHVRFGAKGLIAGLFAEFNSRVDVLIIGAFLADRAVGIYSFAAMLADGMYHVLAMVRLNFNPLLVKANRDSNWEQVRGLLLTSRRYVTPAVVALSVTVVAGYWFCANQWMPEKGLNEGLPSLVILLTALVAVCSLVPFDNLLMVTGHPGLQTCQQLAMVVSNVLFGVILLPIIGMEGVAVGTAISYLVSIFSLILMTRRVIDWNLLTVAIRN